MRTTNNLFRREIIVHILSGDLLSLNESVIFWTFFIIFNILNVFVQWKNGKFQSPKLSTGTSISVTSLIPCYRALSLLSKSVFKTIVNWKANFWCQKIQEVLFWNLSFPDSAGWLRYISQNDRLPLLSLPFSLEATRSCHSVMSDSWSALPWKYVPGQIITEDVSSRLLLFSFRL